MNVEIIKLGGNVLKTEKDRLMCFNKIDFNNGFKKIIICSAMGRSGFPYSTDNLNALAIDISDVEKDRLLGCGEIISSVVMSSFFNKLGKKAYSLSYLDIGICVSKRNNKSEVVNLSNDRIIKLIKEYDVLLIPGFIAYDDNKDIVTLGRGNSDLTAMIIAKMLGINKVTLYKDVLGVYPFMILPLLNYKYYKQLNYNEADEMINSGCNIISKDALTYAKNSNIEINITGYNSNENGSIINNNYIEKKAIGFFMKGKMFDVISFYPCYIKDKLNDVFKTKHIILKKEYVEGNHYYFKLESSQILLAKKIIVDTFFLEFIK